LPIDAGIVPESVLELRSLQWATHTRERERERERESEREKRHQYKQVAHTATHMSATDIHIEHIYKAINAIRNGTNQIVAVQYTVVHIVKQFLVGFCSCSEMRCMPQYIH
jgi:hypothetical protein